MFRIYLGKIIIRIRMFIDKSAEFFKDKLILIYIRNEAYFLRKKVTKKKGVKIINKNVRRTIKAYSLQKFGKTAFWPYLALYSEIRGEFKEGWIPYDYYRFYLLPKINPKPAMYFNDLKTFDFQLFGNFAIEPLFCFITGLFYGSAFEPFDIHVVNSFFSSYNDIIVIKEEGGWGGQQVKIIHSSLFSENDLKKNKNYVIQPYIKQYKTLNDLYPHSVNTFRINTFIQKDGNVVVKYVWLRFGSDGKNMDNMTTGGNYLYFDLNGKPEKMIYDDLGFPLGDRHKNTGFLFADVKIPMFGEMLERCKYAHRKFPYVRLIAWDVCINEAGEPKLIEWNANNPSFPKQEARFGPLWKDALENIYN